MTFPVVPHYLGYPLSTRFSHRPWQAWTLLDSEIFSWQKYLHNYHKLWLCLLCLITFLPPPPWDFLAGPEKDELSLTVRLSRGQNPTNPESLKITTNYDFSCRTSLPWQPPPPMRFSQRPWQSWTVLDSEIFSWQKYLHNYHKLWLCLLCLITLTPPPSMRFSRWPWEAWTLLDGEIISWSKSHQPWKTWSLLYFSHSPKIYHPWQFSRGVWGQTLCSWVFHKPWKIKNNLNISETQILHVM